MIYFQNLGIWLQNLSTQVLSVTGSLNLKIALILFFLCLIGEIIIALPYFLEIIWLAAGYQLVQGNLTALNLLYIWLAAQAGRQAGSLVLYYSSYLGMVPLKKLYKRWVEPRLPKNARVPAAILKGLTNPSAFSVAICRLVGLRVPIALTMSARQKLATLALGVLLSSVVWDGVYLILGSTVGAAFRPKPEYMLLYSVAILLVLYLATIGIRHIWHVWAARGKTTY
jgi:membrane protein DedA with SNARE-associated domain